MTLSAFILAAGRGERLRPITDFIPKPLLPILGKPVLESVLERVSSLGIRRIGINLHHKKEDIEKWIKQSPFSDQIEFFPEDPALGTGGALKNAEGFLKKATFLVHNSDILSDMNLTCLVDYHLSSGNLVTLAVHDYPKFNSLAVDKKGLLKKIINHTLPDLPPSRGRALAYALSSKRKSDKNPCGKTEPYPLSPGGRELGGEGKFLAFTGIAVYQPEFLKILPPGVSSVVDGWRKAIDQGREIGTFDVTGCRWTDIGTPVSYAKAVIAELRANGETVFLHPSVKTCKGIEMGGYVVIEKMSNPPPPSFRKVGPKESVLRNCIILQGSCMSAGSRYENCIVGPQSKIGLQASDLFDAGRHGTFLIGTGGSDRKYYRTKKGEQSVVLMQCQKNDPDFERQIEYTRFFRKYSVPAPELLKADLDVKSAVFEDLGDLSLYSWLKCPREKKQEERVYRKVIDILVPIHADATEHISECPLLQERIFDYDYLRWETDYFTERFVLGIRNIRISNLSALKDEFHRLAASVDSFHKTIIHRDFQSQNIMITTGEIPRILDYQGARIGPPAYDLASILWDPYYRLEDDLRERLVDYYIGRTGISEKQFRDTLLPCRLQRHMQALGAYGFLSSVKGKRYFLKYVPEALRLLREDMATARKNFPVLNIMVNKL